MRTTFIYMLFFCLLLSNTCLRAQETEQSITYAEKYLDARTSDLSKYLNRSGKIQQRLLRRLQRKEAKIARKLAAKDSALYKQYIGQRLSYDSIARLQQDTTALRQRFAARKNAMIDSLKNVQSFISKQSNKLTSVTGLAEKAGADIPYTAELSQLQQQLNAQQGIDELIQQRTSSLEGLAGKVDISGLQNIQKQVYYAQEKIKAWKTMADDPDEAEEEALEYLQGTPGFSEAFSSNNAFGGLGNDATAEDLQKLGFQTKQSVNKMLTDKLGNNLGAVQEQMGKQVQEYTDKLGDISGKVKDAKQSISEARQTIAEAKQAKDKLKHIEKPTFKKNPERAKPFWQRLEPQYNFQTTRATPDGLRPAMLELAASVAFKHSPRLSYGLGISLSTGLGQNWQNIRFTYEGIGTRVFADWKALYGFSLQAGYERTFRPRNRAYVNDKPGGNDPSSPASNDNIFKEVFGGQQQAAYIGIMKRYRLNSKYNGTIMAGYNFLWQQEQLRSPWLLRFGWSK